MSGRDVCAVWWLGGVVGYDLRWERGRRMGGGGVFGLFFLFFLSLCLLMYSK